MPFELQGHRGARGLAPENTLPSFELALDAGVSSIETDLRLTRDVQVVLFHDACVSEKLCERGPGADVPDPRWHPPVHSLTLQQLRGYRVVRNPDSARFPGQEARLTPVAQEFVKERGIDPFAIPSLTDLFQFGRQYAAAHPKAERVVFDLECKAMPFDPEERARADLLTRESLVAVWAARVVDRVRVRSFDHRLVRAMKEMEPALQGAVLIADTAPVDPALMTNDALAETYCPDYHFLDEDLVRRLHEDNMKVIPWTVNDPAAWERLLAWGVDGITTDYPNQLAVFLKERGVEVL